jgi:uncharacterized repeat protein (TIGR01451 family)
MSDLAHHTTCGGEHLYHSPTLAWTMFQVKARVLQEDWDILARQLPEPVSFNSRYDLYRLENLVTLLDLCVPNAVDDSHKGVTPAVAEYGDTLTYILALVGSGQPMTVTDAIPDDTSYVAYSADMSPDVGNLTTSPSQITWTGTVTEAFPFQVTFQARVETRLPRAIWNVARLQLEGDTNVYDLRALAIANGYKSYLPLVLRN